MRQNHVVLAAGHDDMLQMTGLPSILPVEEAINRLLHLGAHILGRPIQQRDEDGTGSAHLEPGE